MTTKSLLNTLNLTQKPQKISISKEMHMRTKLLASLVEQRTMADCMLKGVHFEIKVERWVKDRETGERVKKTLPKRLKAWYFEANNKMYFEVRYANKALELTKGKAAIEIEDKAKLITTIDTVIEAVKNGELDSVLKARIKKAA
jgi:uncharacterized protein YjaZ